MGITWPPLNNSHYITYGNGGNIDYRHEMWLLDVIYGGYYWELKKKFVNFFLVIEFGTIGKSHYKHLFWLLLKN